LMDPTPYNTAARAGQLDARVAALSPGVSDPALTLVNLFSDTGPQSFDLWADPQFEKNLTLLSQSPAGKRYNRILVDEVKILYNDPYTVSLVDIPAQIVSDATITGYGVYCYALTYYNLLHR